jgi:hypothetical protein
MKILIITDYSAFETRMDLNHKHIIDRLKADSRFTVADCHSVDLKVYSQYDVIINDIWPNINWGRTHKDQRVGRLYEDYYQIENPESAQYDFAIFHYKTPVTMYSSLFPMERKYYLNHHFDLNIWKNYQLPKQYDIIIYGSLCRELYPFRVRLAELILQQKSKYRVLHISHPGYNFQAPPVRLRQLSRLINSAWMSLSVPTDPQKGYDDLLKKYGETSLSYSLVLGSIPNEAQDIYLNNYCHLGVEMSDDQILQTIDQELVNKSKIVEKTESVYKKFRENFDLEKYPDKLFEIAKSAFSGGNPHNPWGKPP